MSNSDIKYLSSISIHKKLKLRSIFHLLDPCMLHLAFTVTYFIDYVSIFFPNQIFEFRFALVNTYYTESFTSQVAIASVFLLLYRRCAQSKLLVCLFQSTRASSNRKYHKWKKKSLWSFINKVIDRSRESVSIGFIVRFI